MVAHHAAMHAIRECVVGENVRRSSILSRHSVPIYHDYLGYGPTFVGAVDLSLGHSKGVVPFASENVPLIKPSWPIGSRIISSSLVSALGLKRLIFFA